jgi:hypothetical protein
MTTDVAAAGRIRNKGGCREKREGEWGANSTKRCGAKDDE